MPCSVLVAKWQHVLYFSTAITLYNQYTCVLQNDKLKQRKFYVASSNLTVHQQYVAKGRKCHESMFVVYLHGHETFTYVKRVGDVLLLISSATLKKGSIHIRGGMYSY